MVAQLKHVLRGPVVITGARGMLGSDLTLFFREELGEENVVALSRQELDITSEVQVMGMLREWKPSVVINAAAYTNVDGAEREKDKAKLLNVVGPQILAQSCALEGAKLVHFSTDYVFNGVNDKPWTEEDTPNPPEPNYYGQSKLEGEIAVRSIENHLVLRVQWLYGDKKDRFTILKEKTIFTPFRDQFGAPQWTREISRIVGELLARNAKGLFHFAYDDYASWAEVYEFVKEELQLDVKLMPMASEDVLLPAKRPAFGALSNRKLVEFLGWNSLGSWKEPLREFLRSKTLPDPRMASEAVRENPVRNFQ